MTPETPESPLEPVTLRYRPEWQSFLPLGAAGSGILGALGWFADAGLGVIAGCFLASAGLVAMSRSELSRELVVDGAGLAFSAGGAVQRAPWSDVTTVRFSRFVPRRTGGGHYAPLPILEALAGVDAKAAAALVASTRPLELAAARAGSPRAALHALLAEASDNWEVRITVQGGATKRLRGVHFEQPRDALLALAGAAALCWPGAQPDGAPAGPAMA
ncbi:MAG: hypothetical protein H6747_04345 [Deltaproteobacteria bacterium]|nr:hypothetical protein [Deltaproteobacteria bacterium]